MSFGKGKWPAFATPSVYGGDSGDVRLEVGDAGMDFRDYVAVRMMEVAYSNVLRRLSAANVSIDDLRQIASQAITVADVFCQQLSRQTPLAETTTERDEC